MSKYFQIQQLLFPVFGKKENRTVTYQFNDRGTSLDLIILLYAPYVAAELVVTFPVKP